MNPFLFFPTRGEVNMTCRAIEPFQKGEIKTFIQHIESGVAIALQDPESLLIFSGYARVALDIVDLANNIY